MNAGDADTRMPAASMAALLIASAQAPLGSTLIAVALPSIGIGIGADLVLITGLLVTGYLVVNVVGQGPAGKISDLVGHSRILWTGIGLYVIGAGIGLLAQGVGLLFVSRCTMAAAGALVVPATLALMRLHVPEARRGRIFGLFGATMGIAAAGGPALGGEIVSLFGWRSVFVANLPFLAISALLLYRYPLPAGHLTTRRSLRALTRSLDVVGIGLLALSLTLLIVASRLDGPGFIVAILAGTLVAIAFVTWEAKAAAPVFDPHLFSLPAFAAGTLMIALQNFAMYGLLYQLPQFFAVFRGAAPRDIGYMLFVMMIGMVVAAPVGGHLTDRISARSASLLGCALLLSAMVPLWHLEAFEAPQDAMLALLIFGLGLGLCNAPAQASLMSAVASRQAGMAAGVSSTMRYLGGILSILVLGAVLGGDTLVSVTRHEVMIGLFTVAIVLSALMSRRLLGAGKTAAGSP